MVASASPAIQVMEAEKKRKQTIERAKANHLSRQLQLRLQYAKLKVEHGWQKQSLNEVENLFFRHSHIHGRRPSSSTSVVATTQSNPAIGDVRSSLSFKLGSSSFTLPSTPHEDAWTVEYAPGATPSSVTASDTVPDIAIHPPTANPISIESNPTPGPSKSAQPLRAQPTELISHPTNSCPPAPWPSPPLTNNAPLPSSASSLYYRSSNSTLSSSPSKTSDSLRFSPSSLTYDSFWSSLASSSSMSSSSASARAVGPNNGDPPALIPAAKIVQGRYRRSNVSRHPQGKES